MKRYIWLPALFISSCIWASELKEIDCTQSSAYRASNACSPTVMVIRHAEDGGENGEHYLTDAGMNHANLYINLFNSYVYGKAHSIGKGGEEVCICPIKKIIAIDPNPNSINKNPSSNPYETIKPLASYLALSIDIIEQSTNTPYSTAFEWVTASRKGLLVNKPTEPYSVVIAWDKQGLNPSLTEIEKAKSYGLNLDHKPLLKKLAKYFSPEPTDKQVNDGHFTPQRNHFFVFAEQDQEDGKFSTFKLYTQQVSFDGKNWFENSFLKDKPTFIRLRSD